MVGQATDGAIGVGPVGDVDPQRGAALTGVPEVQFDGGWVVGDGADDPPGQGPLGQEPLVILQDLLTGVDRSSVEANPASTNPALACSAWSASSRMATRNPWGLKANGRAPREGSWSVMPMGQATWFAVMALWLPIGDRLAPADQARAYRGDAGSCRCQQTYVLWVGYWAIALLWATGRAGVGGLVAARSRSSSTPDRAMKVIAP